MARKADVPRLGLDAALTLAATVGWRDLSLSDIAAEAGVTLAQLREAYPSKDALLDAFSSRIDEIVLAGTPADLAAEPVKDRLFDVLMRRFEALGPWREAVRAIVRAQSCDPLAAVVGACRLDRSMRWMLEAAGLDGSSAAGRLRAKALAALYVDVMRTWMTDDSEDMARTMAALDRRLAQADDAMARLCRLAARARSAAPAREAA